MKKIKVDLEQWKKLLKQDKLDASVNVRMTLEMKNWYEKTALKLGTNSNRLIRKVLQTYMEVSEEQEKKATGGIE